MADAEKAGELLVKATHNLPFAPGARGSFLHTTYQCPVSFNSSSREASGVDGTQEGEVLTSGLYSERSLGALKSKPRGAS